MAKPIHATPVLFGKEALRFVSAMRRREQQNYLSRTDKHFLEIIKKNENLFRG